LSPRPPVSNATQAVQSTAAALGAADAEPLGASLAAADGAALGAVVAPPPPVHAVRMKAAVAPSDSSRIELRKVNSSSYGRGTMTDRDLRCRRIRYRRGGVDDAATTESREG
jgi:hypothetical protein